MGPGPAKGERVSGARPEGDGLWNAEVVDGGAAGKPARRGPGPARGAPARRVASPRAAPHAQGARYAVQSRMILPLRAVDASSKAASKSRCE